MKKDEINVEVNKEMEQGNEVEYCGEVCKNAFRTASIEFLEVTVAYADFATKQFGEAKALYFDNVEATVTTKITTETFSTADSINSAFGTPCYRVRRAD